MKQIAVTIPDDKEKLFMELMKSLSFVKHVETFEIPDWHKNIIEERIEDYAKHPEEHEEWGTLKKKLDQKYCQ